MAVEPTNSYGDVPPADDGDGSDHATPDGGKTPPPIKPVDFDRLADLRQARKDRIARIKAEIEAGTYDSDELLDAALGRMLDSVNLDGDDDQAEEEKS